MSVTTASAETFNALWAWLCAEALNSRADSPIAIHSQSGDRQGWGNVDPHAVTARGMPFSRSFLRRVDRELPRAVKDAVELLKPAACHAQPLRAVRKSQYRIVVAVLRDGQTDVTECRGSLGMSEFAFQTAAIGGILALRSALNR